MGKKQRKAHHCKSQRFKSLPWFVLHLQDFTHSERVLYWIHKRAGSCKENVYEALVGRAGLMYRDSTVKVHIVPGYDIYKCKDMFRVMWPQGFHDYGDLPPSVYGCTKADIATVVARDLHIGTFTSYIHPFCQIELCFIYKNRFMGLFFGNLVLTLSINIDKK